MANQEKVSSIFAEHEHHYSVLSAEITDKLNIIQGNAITGDSVTGPCAEVDRLMLEAEELLEQMELEARDQPAAVRQSLMIAPVTSQLEQMELEARDQPAAVRQSLANRVRSYSAEQRRLAKEYQNIKLRVTRAELLDGDGTRADAMEQLQDNTELMERTGNRLDEGYRMCLESEAMGAEVLNDLSGQRETLTKTRSRLRDTDSELSRSGRLLTGMMHRAIQNRVVLMLVIAVLVAVLLYAVYALVIRSS